MKIDRSKLKRTSAEIPADCKALIDKLKNCNHDQLLYELKQIKSWSCAKCELYHWVDLLDIFDDILGKSCERQHENQWTLPCDSPDWDPKKRELIIQIMSFTALLIEHSFSRHLYSSMDHLITLLSSSDIQIVLAVLGLIFVFGKRSNFIAKLSIEKRQELFNRLSYLAESWGGKENGFGLAECCRDLPMSCYPSSATTLHFEYYTDHNHRSSNSSEPSSMPVTSAAATTNPTLNNSLTQVQSQASCPNAPPVESIYSQPSQTYSQAVRQQQRSTTAPTSQGFDVSQDKRSIDVIHIDNVDQIKDESLASIMERLVATHDVPREKQMQLFTHLRLAHCFSDPVKRMQCVQARLQAISVIIYCAPATSQEIGAQLLYNGFVEELVDILQLEGNHYIDIKSAALRTLTSIIHLDRNSRLSTIIEATETSSYHGFLPILVRNCIQSLINEDERFPIPYATALFSFLYHLASFEKGGEALVSCGMMESLLKVISWTGTEPEHITFVTRSVRVIDLITNIDMSVFQTQSGLNIFVERLEAEVKMCRKELGEDFDDIEMNQNMDETSSDSQQPMDVDSPKTPTHPTVICETIQEEQQSSAAGSSGQHASKTESRVIPNHKDTQCYTQRAALLKSMLNFLKKAVQDSTFSDCIRHLMDGSLPKSLRHIIGNASYYGSTLFLLAIELVSTYVYQEPALLSSLQEIHLTKDILDATLDRPLPPTREVLAALPNTFTALCLNNAGLQAFQARKPFEKIFRVLISPDYLPAMRRRKGDLSNDTPTCLGNAMDELMRHQPSLRADVVAAIINLLKELCELGDNPNFVCSTKPTGKSTDLVANPVSADLRAPAHNNTLEAAAFSDDEDEDDEDSASPPVATDREIAQPTAQPKTLTPTKVPTPQSETIRTPVPLVDFILNVMRFLDAILTNNSTDDHVQEFLRQDGLVPLLKLMRLRNLPIDFPSSTACAAISSVCRSILALARDPKVVQEALKCLDDVLDELEVLRKSTSTLGSSILLEEYGNIANSTNITDPNILSNLTPTLHSMSSAHAYIVMFSCINRSNHLETRNICINHWGKDHGLDVLNKMSRLYMALMWESTVILSLDKKEQSAQSQKQKSSSESNYNTSQSSRRSATSNETEMEDSHQESSESRTVKTETTQTSSSMDVDDTSKSSTSDRRSKSKNRRVHFVEQSKLIKPLLPHISRLAKGIAELFTLLVKLSVGSPLRHRRNNHAMPNPPTVPSIAAQNVASVFAKLITEGLSLEIPPNLPNYRPTFFICFSGFTQSMLFDERKNPFHLMLRDLTHAGGIDAFFKTFEWLASEGSIDQSQNDDSSPLSSGPQAEFLEFWLSVLEKLVNPKLILETPHTMAPKSNSALNYVPFDPIQYLITVHKRAFDAIDYLWMMHSWKSFSDEISEHILLILCHLLKGETIINEHLKKEEESEIQAADASSLSAAPIPANVSQVSNVSRNEYGGFNQDHFQHLIDMGFARESVIDALMQCQTIEQATDFLLTTPQASYSSGAPRRPPTTSNQSAASVSQDVDMATEDSAQDDKAAAANSANNMISALKTVATSVKTQKEEPLSKNRIDVFTDNLLPGALRLMDELPTTVFKVCDLILTVAQRNGPAWCESLLNNLLNDIVEYAKRLLEMAEPLRASDNKSFNEWASQLKKSPEAYKAAFRIHLYSLLFEEMKIQCANLLHKSNAIDTLVELLEVGLDMLSLSKQIKDSTDDQTPKWLAPTILLIDLYEKGAVASHRRAPLLNNMDRTWQYFDERTGRWTPHMPINNKIIDDAYKNGEQYARYTVGRKHYLAQFCTMLQINEESSTLRPIMMSLTPVAEKDVKTGDSLLPTVPTLRSHQTQTLVKVCVGFMQLPTDTYSLQAVMRLAFRLTRDYEIAVMFAEKGGIRALQSLPESVQFTGFVSLATLIIRHVLEEPTVLHQTMEKVIRTTVQHCQHNQREMHYILRVLGPAACRNEEIFKKLATEILRIAPSPISRRDEDESRSRSDAPQLIKLLPPKPPAEPIKPSSVTRRVIEDLLDSLTVPIQKAQDIYAYPVMKIIQSPNNQANEMRHANDPASRSSSSAANMPADYKFQPQSDTTNPPPKTKEHNPMMNHSIVLRLLAELTRSYSVVPKIIAEHTYLADRNVPEDVSALAFILDNILPTTQTHSDRDGPPLARVFLASLAACNHCVEAQIAVVNEVKASLNRASSMPEGCEKHARLQSLATMIGTMIDCCPAVSSQQSGVRHNNPAAHQQRLSNNIVRLFVRKGLVTDLARIPNSLDLSAPYMFATVNAILKPLETLSRFVNLPGQPSHNRPNAPPTKKTCSSSSSSSDLPEDSNSHTLNMDTNQTAESGGQQFTANNSSQTVAAEEGQPGAAAAISEVISDEVIANEQDFEPPTHVVVRPLGSNSSGANAAGANGGSGSVNNERNSESRDNVVNSNGAESESGEGSRSEDEDEDEEDDNGEVSGVDEREEDADDEDDDEDEDDEDEDHVDDDEEHVDDDEGDDDENLNAFGENQFADDYRIYNGSLNNVLSDIEEAFAHQNNAVYPNRLDAILPMFDGHLEQHESSAPTLPPPPGNVGLTHPLLLRRMDHVQSHGQIQATSAPPVIGRSHRYSRPRMIRNAPVGGQGSQWHSGASGRQPHQTILQQLLGPNTVQEVMTLTNHIVGPGRLFVADFQNWLATEDELHPDNLDPHLVSSSNGTALATIPLVMARWNEESRILDGPSLYDCLTNIKLEIVATLERFRDEENLDRQEKRKKMVEDDEQAQQKKCKEPAAAAPISQELQISSSPQQQATANMQVTETLSVNTPAAENQPHQQLQQEPTPSQAGTAQLLGTTTPAAQSVDAARDNMARDEQMQDLFRRHQLMPEPPSDRVQVVMPPSEPDESYESADLDACLEVVREPSPPVLEQNVVEEMQASEPIATVEEPDQLTPTVTQPASDQPQPVPTVQQPPEQQQQAETNPANPPDSEIPDGVDPSFLAALPDDIRQEVLAEQWRLRRMERAASNRQAAGQAQAAGSAATDQPSTSSAPSNFPEVNPEFLAALPVEVQEEVLAQQRAEQQRQAALNANPDQPVDPATFIQTLAPNLRRQVLADMDDSLLSLLPPELNAEAQALRREMLTSNASASSTLSRLLRTAAAGRMQRARYTITSVPDHVHNQPSWSWALNRTGPLHDDRSNRTLLALSRDSKFKGRQLLDCDALTCLVILLFVEEPKLNISRLHRVLRNLSYHQPTRHWVVQSIMSIIERAKTSDESARHTPSPIKGSRRHGGKSADTNEDPNKLNHSYSWPSISMDAALGCRASVFSIQKSATQQSSVSGGSSSSALVPYSGKDINVHIQAAPSVCRHMLEALIALAKSFPQHFFPEGLHLADDSSADSDSNSTLGPDFWEILARLNSFMNNLNNSGSSGTKKGSRGTGKQTQSSSASSNQVAPITSDPQSSEANMSPLAILMGFLAHPIIKKNFILTDRLLHLLATISNAFPIPPTPVYASEFSRPQLARRSHPPHMYYPAHGGPVSVHRQSMQTAVRSAGPLPPLPNAYDQYAGSESMGATHATGATNSSSSRSSRTYSAKRSDPPVCDPPKSSKSTDPAKPRQPLVARQYLKLAVDVLTSKSCSEEGLDDVTALLSRLSKCCSATRAIVLELLMDGARQLGRTVCQNIAILQKQLKDYNSKLRSKAAAAAAAAAASASDGSSPSSKGVVQDRFTNDVVIITTPSGSAKSGREVQLPSMTNLTSKNSSQAFLLRILKVIIQLRETPRHHSSASGHHSRVSTNSQQQNLTSTPVSASSNTQDQGSAAVASDQQSSDQQVATGQSAMEVDQASTSQSGPTPTTTAQPVDVTMKIEDGSSTSNKPQEESLSLELQLDDLWETLSQCLLELAETPDHHAVLVLQPAVEVFFLVHSPGLSQRNSGHNDDHGADKNNQTAHIDQEVAPIEPADGSSSQQNEITGQTSGLSYDTRKFLKFAETHRVVLNHILRQSTTPLSQGPFAVLVDHTRILDFDVKRRYFRQELERLDEGIRRDDLGIHVRRDNVFEESFRELHRRVAEEWKNRFFVVFHDEEGQDAGGLLREWYTIISREIFNPMYALFTTSPGDRVTYMINSASHCNTNHLTYFKFVGRVIAKAIYDNKLLDCYFTRSFYKHILGKPVKYTDMESEDYSFYQGLVFLLEHDVKELGYELTFSVEVREFGVVEVRELKPGGSNIPVTEENKHEYVRLVCQEKMTGSIRKQLNAFLEGFYDIIPKRLISIFNEQELELLISGLPNFDIDDLKASTEYHKYLPNSLQIQWFWRALRSFDRADRAKLLQFVTGTSKVPLQGFASLEGMNGVQKFQIHRDERSTDRLPSAHTCFNQLDLPVYETYDKLRYMLLKAIQECSEGFGLA